DEFEKIRFSPVLSDVLMTDPTKYMFRVEAYWGERMELVLYGPGRSAPHQPSPMLEWVERLRRLLSGSGGSKTCDRSCWKAKATPYRGFARMIADEDQTSRAKAPNSKRTLYAAMNGRSSTATQPRAPPPSKPKPGLPGTPRCAT